MLLMVVAWPGPNIGTIVAVVVVAIDPDVARTMDDAGISVVVAILAGHISHYSEPVWTKEK
jgi:hypothetical protein